MKVLSLGGEYELFSASGRFHCRADIPGSDIGNLIKYSSLGDPLNAADTDKICSDIAGENFTFTRSFTVEGELLGYQNARLCCEKLDTLCEIFINSHKVAVSSNAHLPLRTDILRFLMAGENTLELKFRSPLKYVIERQKGRHLPPNVNGVNGAQYLRKPNCHFGWDWGPCVPYCGCGEIKIEFFNTAVENIRIKQRTTPELSVITVSAENALRCRLFAPDGEEISPADGGFEFTVTDPELWYTRDLSEKERQPLYTLQIIGEEMTVTRRLGLRDIRLKREKDEWGESFGFTVNGRRVFAKGANVIPFAALPEYADEKSVDYYVELAAKSNFNILRVWGGGEYAGEHFLDRCDELGILVWQDFCFACMMYPLDEPDFVESVKAEAVANIRRMSHRACLALWCGNNEIEGCNPVMPENSRLRRAYVDYFYNILPGIVGEECEVDYIPTSPVGKAPFAGNSSESLGDCHMWSVWHGLMPLDYYGTRYARFLSEFGMESLPSLKAINKFAPGEKSVYGPSFTAHQKCAGGNRKLMFYLSERFDGEADLKLLPYLSGIMQAECIKAATEHFRRNKGRCSGSVFWQFNDVWNAPSWSAVDFEKVPKALIYKAREFFAPVTLSYSGGNVYIHNDTMSEKSFMADFRVTNGKRLCRVFSKRVTSCPDSVAVLAHVPLAAGEAMSVEIDGRRFVFDNVKKLQPAVLTVSEGDGEITVSSDTFARNIFIDCPEAEENYFSLLPGESKTVQLNGGSVKGIICENNIPFKRRPVKKALFMLGYRLKPDNAVKALWYALQ